VDENLATSEGEMTDRELDRQVAEKIMGINNAHKSVLDPFLARPDAPFLSRYTTDPSAFMQVVEKMREKNIFLKFGPDPTKPLYTVQVISKHKRGFTLCTETLLWKSDESLGRAICLAALEAVK